MDTTGQKVSRGLNGSQAVREKNPLVSKVRRYALCNLSKRHAGRVASCPPGLFVFRINDLSGTDACGPTHATVLFSLAPRECRYRAATEQHSGLQPATSCRQVPYGLLPL